MSAPTIACPSCGKPTGGKFCRHCGAGTGSAADHCARCGSPLGAGVRFCSQCGTSAAAAPGGLGRNERLIWFAAGGLVVAALGGVVLTLSKGNAAPPVAEASAAQAPFGSGADGGGAVPDISNMSPRERFDKLFDRIMRAAESGDANTVTTFAPMAIQAYGMLDTVDSDARYHLALIQLHTGDVDGARAQGDSILKTQPGHLFGYIIKGTIARFQNDDKSLAKAYAEYLSHLDKETAAKRPEYKSHARALEDFTKQARAAKGGA
jgi:zinc ribbon protein